MSRRLLWAVLVFVLGGVIAAWLVQDQLPMYRRPASTGPLPEFGAAPEFRLADQLGRTVSSAELRGQPWVADFIFTRCAGPCPMMSARMARLADTLGVRSPVRFVSFTVDPDYDSSEVLRGYAEVLGADPERWRFLTGSRAELLRVSVKGFHLAMGDAEADSSGTLMTVAHSTRFILVDRDGVIRGYYDGEDQAALENLVRDVQALMVGRS